MTFAYQGGGTIKLDGCVCPTKQIYLYYKWSENSFAYLKYKAQKGVMERIAIKRVIINKNARTAYADVVLYQDTLNSLYNESDLITEDEAKYLAQIYWLTQLEEYQRNYC
jgi:hypothetical protein